ncbi:hypothetical protein BH23BAC2_BH23BAC2_19190 [soil metagenome]
MFGVWGLLFVVCCFWERGNLQRVISCQLSVVSCQLKKVESYYVLSVVCCELSVEKSGKWKVERGNRKVTTCYQLSVISCQLKKVESGERKEESYNVLSVGLTPPLGVGGPLLPLWGLGGLYSPFGGWGAVLTTQFSILNTH